MNAQIRRNIVQTSPMRLSLLALASACLASTAWAQEPAYQASEQALELTVHYHFRNQYVYTQDWPVEQKAAELTNVSVRNVASSASTNSQDAFNLMITSGDLADIVGGVKDDFNRYGREGAFLPLDELIAEHAPHIQAYFDANPDFRNAAAGADGKLYYIPYIQDGTLSEGWFIRQDWLEKLGLESPETPEEVYTVLKAFREQDPNGNGQKDEIPYFARNQGNMLRLMNLWDARVSGSATYGDFAVYDGELRHPWAEETYKTAMSNLAQWYAEGLIDPEIFTRGPRAREYLLGNDLGGMTHDWFPSTSTYNVSLAETIDGFSFKPMLPPKTISGDRFEDARRQIVTAEGWGISVANEHPVETIRYFDFWFTELGRQMANFGVEGETYTIVDGKPTFTEAVLTDGQPVNAQLWEIGAQVPRGYVMDYDYELQWSNEIALEGMQLYEACDCLKPDFMGVALTDSEKAVYDRHWPSILTYMQEMQQTWLLGAQDVESTWDDYQSRLDQMGYGEVLEVMQTAYQRQYGATQ